MSNLPSSPLFSFCRSRILPAIVFSAFDGSSRSITPAFGHTMHAAGEAIRPGVAKMFLCALLCGLFFVITPAAPARGEATKDQLVYVQVKDTKLRATPQFWGASAADLKYGDQLTVISSQDGWLKVKNGGKAQGFVHVTAVTPRKVVLSAKGDSVVAQADRGDIVLAGKGFGPAAERALVASGGGGDFRAVDAMERLRVSSQDILQFVREGKLTKQG